jgi:hypothetical protein
MSTDEQEWLIRHGSWNEDSLLEWPFRTQFRKDDCSKVAIFSDSTRLCNKTSGGLTRNEQGQLVKKFEEQQDRPLMEGQFLEIYHV